MTLNHSSKYSELTEQHFSAIGKIVVEWSNIESCLGTILSRLSFSPDLIGSIISNELNAVKLHNSVVKAIDVQRDLYENHFIPEETLKEIENALMRMNAIRVKRNKLSHFLWCRSSDSHIFGFNPIGILASNPKIHKAFQSFSVDDLVSLHHTAYGLVEDLIKIIEKLPRHGIDER